MQQKGIHWYPGHMVKALRQIKERVSVVDIIIEVVDARAPLSSKNPFLEDITANKKRLIVFSKRDLADESKIDAFKKHYEAQGYSVIFASLNNPSDVKAVVNKAQEEGKERLEKYIKRGMKPQPLRVMILGIPNVGKSTLINRLAKRNSASVQNTPGHTRAQQWIKVNDKFELLDTPGVLPPHYEDRVISRNLALLGSIKDNILPLSELYEELIKFLKEEYPSYLENRYGITLGEAHEIALSIGEKRKMYLKGGEVDTESVERLVLKEFKEGILGKVVVDKLC